MATLHDAENAERAALAALARTWNRLDPSELDSWLGDDACYESVETELTVAGPAQVMAYIERKVELIELVGDDAAIRAQLATMVTAAGVERPCVVTSQGGVERAALFLVDLDAAGLIGRIRVSVEDPDPAAAKATGWFPGL